jgi:hypothetical protein
MSESDETLCGLALTEDGQTWVRLLPIGSRTTRWR